MRVETLSTRIGTAMFIPADVFGCAIASPKNIKTKKKKHTWAFSTNLHFQIRLCGRRERRAALVARCDLHLLSSPAGINGREVWALKLTDGTLLWELESGQSSWFLIGQERQSATPVTAGHGHHHTSGTWGRKGVRVLLKWISCNSTLTAGGAFLLRLVYVLIRLCGHILSFMLLHPTTLYSWL